MVKRVEKLSSELELRLFGDVEVSSQGQIERLHSGPDDRIPSRISEGESRGRGEGRRIHPAIRRARSIVEDLLPRVVGPNGIFAKHCSGVRCITEYRDGKRESALNLINS